MVIMFLPILLPMGISIWLSFKVEVLKNPAVKLLCFVMFFPLFLFLELATMVGECSSFHNYYEGAEYSFMLSLYLLCSFLFFPIYWLEKSDSLDSVATLFVMFLLSPFFLLDSYVKLSLETLSSPEPLTVIICLPMMMIIFIPLKCYSFAFNKEGTLEEVDNLFMFAMLYMLFPMTICLSLSSLSVTIFFLLFVEKPSQNIIITIFLSLTLVVLLPFLVFVFLFHVISYLMKKA